MNNKDTQGQKTNHLKALIFLLVSLFSVPLAAQSFITTWVTDDTEITIPTSSASYSYNYDITWSNLTNEGIGDGSISGQTGNYTITGLTNGDTYQIEISGAFPHLNMFSHPDANKLMSIEQWGDIEWASMRYAFSGCSNLLYHAIDAPDLTNVTDMSSMFSLAASFNGAIDNWDVSGVTDMSNMFNSATSFNQNLNSWNVGNVTSMNAMFIGASSFNGEIGNWNVSNVENMSFMFQFASSFDEDISAWDVSSVLYMEAMFRNASSFNNGGVALSWTTGTGTSKVIITSDMFENASLFNQSINSWDMGSVTITSGMFRNATAYNQDMSNWDVSNVTNMIQMFQNASSFDQDISDWDVSRVTEMGSMFFGASSYNNGGVALDWVSTMSLVNIGGMFSGASSFNQDVSGWDISKVTSFGGVFQNATSFNNGGVPLTWSSGTGTANVTYMGRMFEGATAFNQDISSWNVSNVLTMLRMFFGASSFNQDISGWDVSNVSDMRLSFYQAVSFDQSLANWDISSATSMIDMLDETNLSPSNYDATLIGWNTLSAGESQIPTGIILGAETLEYTSGGEPSRDSLIGTYGWTISGDELRASTPEISIFQGSDKTAPQITNGQATAIDFGNSTQGSDIIQVFAIENSGTSDLIISSISSSNSAFTINSTPTAIAPGTTETFTITLSGTITGAFAADITIASNDADDGTFVFPIEGQIDGPVPEITINQTLTSSPSPELTGTIDDPAATIEVFVNGSWYAATNNGDGTWTLAEGSISPSLEEGTYDIVARATSLEGLVGEDSSMDELEIIFQSVLSTEKDQNEWVMYPNPTDGNVTLKGVFSKHEELKLEIIQRSGQVLRTLNRREPGRDVRLNLTDLPKGIYVLRIISSGDKSIHHFTFIKN